MDNHSHRIVVLKAQIKRETRKLIRENLRFELRGLIKQLAAKDYAEKVKRLSGNI